MTSVRSQLASKTAKALKLPTDLPQQLILDNPSHELPYHNNEHAYAVAVNTHIIGTAQNLTLTELQHLFVAGLLHDYAHTGNSQHGDTPNIQQAVKIVQHKTGMLKTYNVDPLIISRLILATNTDYQTNPEDNHWNPSEQAIQDADLLEWGLCDFARFTQLCSGLTIETQTPVTLESTRTFLQKHAFNYTATGILLAWNGLATDNREYIAQNVPTAHSWYKWKLNTM